RATGARIRTDAPGHRILGAHGRAVGVALESGEEIRANAVLSSVDVWGTFLSLIEPGTLDGGFEAELRRYKFRGSSGKVNLALDGLPEFTCLPGTGEHVPRALRSRRSAA